jgi:hypothetical protein
MPFGRLQNPSKGKWADASRLSWRPQLFPARRPDLAADSRHLPLRAASPWAKIVPIKKPCIDDLTFPRAKRDAASIICIVGSQMTLVIQN